MKKLNIQLVSWLLGCAGILTSAAQTIPGWNLVWSDEFTQADGSAPNSTKWGYDLGGGGWGNSELETYTSRTNNARIENNQLVIEAKQENFTGTDNIPRNYTSARLLTKGKWAWTYGRMEARIKIPRGQGIWPAFWMLGANIDSVSWPTCGEIDIMENIGREPATVHGTVHGPGYSGGNGISGLYTLPGGAALADDFHVFAIEWVTNRIRWYMDGQQYFTVTPAQLPNGATWVFNQPQFLIMNLAVGGAWPGNPDGTTVFPQRMTVDYVRVYAATNDTVTPTNALRCAGNVLANPGFETTSSLVNWTTYGNTIPNTLLGSSNSLPVHGGSNLFKVFGQFTGGLNYAGIFQDLPTTAGTPYTAAIWAQTPTGDKIAVGNTAWFEISFRDASENILGLYRTALITNSSPGGTWLNLAVTNQLDTVTSALIGAVTNLVAPVGTTFVRSQIVFRQPANAAGAVLFDDLSLNFPGDPSVGIAATALKNGNNLNVSFATGLGLNYQVQFKPELTTASWSPWTNVVGDGGVKTVADPLGPGRKFYRVMQVCN